MSKRNKKFRPKRSNLKLETLETRQLLATIVGSTGGTEVGSNITVAGKVYDQILMTGSTISVQADPGQIVRVDFMDPDGDILHTEFSGAGTLNITLANFVGAAVPTKYNIPATTLVPGYVSGLATFTVSGENASSNFLVTSVGPVTAFNGLLNPIFSNGTLTGGNNTANVSRLVLFGDGTTLTGSSMGSIFAGNAVFSDTAGTTGLIASNVNFVAGSTITLGDIVPLGNATPVLQIGAFSAVTTVKIAGGTLPNVPSGSTGLGYQAATFGSGVTDLVSAAGTNSKGTVLQTQAIANNPSGAKVSYNTTGLGTITVDGSTATTASLDALYKNSFLGDVVINNGLAAGVTFHAFQFGNITVNGDLAGVITTDVNNDNLSGDPEQGIGSVTINGNIVDGGYIEASTSIGDVTVTGSVTHTVVAPSVTASVGSVPLALGIITTLGRTNASAAIGNITFNGDVNETAAESVITANRSTSTTTTGGIASISGISLFANTGASTLPIISSLGPSTAQGIGNLNFLGSLSLTGGAGGLVSSLSVGNISARSLTLNTNASNGIVASGTAGSIGDITAIGGGLTLTSGQITSATSIGNISLVNSGNATIGQPISAVTNIGNISLDSGNLTTTAAITAGGSVGGTGSGNIGTITLKSGNLSLDNNIIATGGNLGAISVKNSTATAVVGVTRAAVIQATVNATTLLGGTVGDISVTSTGSSVTGNLTFGTGGNTGSVLGTKIGNISVSSGNLVFANIGSQILASTTAADVWLGSSIGNVTIAGGAILGTSGNIEFQANKIGNVSVVGASATSVLLSDVIFSAKGTTQAAALTASIGNITLDNSAASSGVISKSLGAAAATTSTTGTGFSSTGNLGNVTVSASLTGKILNDVTTASLIFRAGSSEMASAATTLASGVAIKTSSAATTINTVSIGNVSITGNLSTGLSAPARAGVGLVVDAGADVVSAGVFANIAQNSSTAVGLGTSTLGTGLATDALTSGSIGSLVLVDNSGNINRSAFNTAQLTENNAGAHTAVSTIIADNIASVVVNGGVQLLNFVPLGSALKGVINSTATSASQTFSANSGDLVIVIL